MSSRFTTSTHSHIISGCFFVALILSITSSTAIATGPIERAQRPMQVQKHSDMGLEIWVENSPKWVVEKRFLGKRPILFVQSPPNTYPPASMSVISYANMMPGADDFDVYSEVALSEGIEQYGVSPQQLETLVRERKQYGDLSGIEVNFVAKVHGTLADVKLFIGNGNLKGPVLLQLYTVKGKMQHLSEQIRRSWSNIRYL